MEMKYDLNRPWLTLDHWQKEFIGEIDKDCWLLKGRQVGGSTAAGIKVIEVAKAKETKLTGKGEYQISGFTEEQGGHIFEKALAYCQARYPHLIDMRAGKKPTNHNFYLKNGSHIFLKALGLMGAGARGKSPKRVWIDEAPLCMRQVFVAMIPSLAISGGKIDLLGTPQGKQGYFYECSDEPEIEEPMDNFRRWKVSTEDCPRYNKEQLKKNREMLNSKEYAQEFLGEFLDDFQRVFADEIIQRSCVLNKPEGIMKAKYYLGVDIARMGEDKISFQIIKKVDGDNFRHVYSEIAKKKLTTWTEQRIIDLDKLYNFKKIGIDAGAGSLGVGIYDHLINEPKLVNKIVAINNREIVSRIDKKKDKFKIRNEELYNNLLWGMQKKKLKLLKDNEVGLSLASVLWEHVSSVGKLTKVRYFGNNTHTAEALHRAFWEAVHDTSLELWAR